MVRCEACGRSSDRLTPLLEARRYEVSEALGLDRMAVHAKVLARIAELVAAAGVVDPTLDP